MFFLKIQEHNPSSPAVIADKKTHSYSDLIEKIKFFSGKLEQFRINPGDHAAIICQNKFDFIPLLFALWNSGAAAVLINNKLTENEILEKISFSGCKYVFIHRNLAEKLQINISNRIIFPFNEETAEEHNYVYRKTSGDETAVIIFTSGSSGRPKGVMLSFDNLMQSALIGNKVLGININDRLLASLPFYHIGGFSIIIRTLLFGASIIIPDSLSAEDLIESLKLFKPTIVSLVSNQLKKLIDKKIVPPEELRLSLLGGGFFDKDLILKAIADGWKTAKVYGSTESSSFVSFMHTEEVRKNPEASGKVITPNEIFIRDGEIVIKSPAVMKGYYNNDKENALRLKKGYYYTGDTGYFDDEGYLSVEAKRDDLVISGGENINPAEVEKEILNHPKIKDVSVVGIEDAQWGQMLCAAVVIQKKEKFSEDELKSFLKGKLASFKIPKQIIFVDHLPKTDLGKVKKEKVQELFRNKS